MASTVERLALADAMQLHDERVRNAIDRARQLRSDLEDAEAHQRAVMQARRAFIDAVKAEGATP